MQEIATAGIGAGVLAYLAKDGVAKLLGPTSDYLGKEMKQWVEKRHQNVKRILGKACEKVGSDLENAGGVPPRVLKELLGEGSFADDELAAEYFGGVMACSRSKTSDNDLYLSSMKLIGQLSSFELRSHYVLYAALHRSLCRRQVSHRQIEFPKNQFFISFDDFSRSAQFSGKHEGTTNFFYGCLNALERNRLVERLVWGTKDFLQSQIKDLAVFNEGGICFTPTDFGIELFLHAHGIKEYDIWAFHKIKLEAFSHLPLQIRGSADYIDALGAA